MIRRSAAPAWSPTTASAKTWAKRRARPGQNCAPQGLRRRAAPPPQGLRRRATPPLAAGGGALCAAVQVDALEAGDRVLLVGCTSDPTACAKKDEAGFINFWDRSIHVPEPVYGDRLCLWPALAARFGGAFPQHMPISGLAHISEARQPSTAPTPDCPPSLAFAPPPAISPSPPRSRHTFHRTCCLPCL